MSLPDFDFNQYVSEICKGIKSRPKREEIMEELLGHLEDNYERNLAVGMSEDEARLDAINKMGDGELLSYYLSEVHSYSPLKEMNSTLVQIIIAFISMNFLFSGALKEALAIIGLLLMFFPLLRMRKMNKKAEKAFHFFNFFALTQLFYYCISLGNILPFEAEAVYIVLYSLFKGLFWLFLFSGLNEACEKHLGEEVKKPKLISCGVYYMLSSFFTGFILIMSEGENTTFDDFIIPIIMIFMFVFTIVQLVRTRSLLWDADGEYGILPADKKHFTVYACVFVGCIATVLVFNYASATRSPVKTELVIHDVSAEEQAEADKVRQKMLDWDVKEQIVEDLPDSEILRYKDAGFVTWGADGGSLFGNSEASCVVWYYFFFFPDEHDPQYCSDVRLLCYIESEYSDKVKSFYRKGFYYAPWDNVVPLNTGENLNGSYISIITDENGKKYNAEPFFTYNLGDDYVLEWPKGFEYSEEKGQRVYYAANIGIQNLSDNVPINAFTVRQSRWFYRYMYNTSADFTKDFLDYGKCSVVSDKRIAYKTRNHKLDTGNFSDDDYENLLNKSTEYYNYLK